MSAYVYLNAQKDLLFENSIKVISALQENDIHCIVNEYYKNDIRLPDITFLNEQDALEQCDIVITIGGDGTILKAASLLFDNEKPLLGVNLGRVGFLALVELNELHLFEKLKKKEYFIEERSLLDVFVNDKKIGTAFNEALISQGLMATAIGIELFCDDIPVNRYMADGLLIATPTGSTAYSLSAGGPILDAKVNACVVTPICAHSLYSPAMVFSADRTLSIQLLPDDRVHEYSVIIDGRDKVRITEQDTVTIVKSSKHVKLISFSEAKQFSSIDTKLKWR